MGAPTPAPGRLPCGENGEECGEREREARFTALAEVLTTRHVQTLHSTVVSPLERACRRTAQVVGRACSETGNSYESGCPPLHRSYCTPIFEWHVLSHPRGAVEPIAMHLQ